MKTIGAQRLYEYLKESVRSVDFQTSAIATFSNPNYEPAEFENRQRHAKVVIELDLPEVAALFGTEFAVSRGQVADIVVKQLVAIYEGEIVE